MYTDHSLLTKIKTNKDITGKLMNMILKLQKYDFKLVYLLGKKNVVADVLSCTPIAKKNMKEIKEAIKKKEIGPIRMDNMEWRHAVIAALSIDEMKEELKKKNKEGIIPTQERQKKKVRMILTHASKKQGPYMVDEDTMSKEQLLNDMLSRCWEATLLDNTHWIIVDEVLYYVRKEKRRNGKKWM